MKRAIQFGAGNIGRGFIGAVLSEAGYHVVFADVNMEVIDRINKDGAYTVHIMDVESRDVRISNISGVDSGGGEIVASWSSMPNMICTMPIASATEKNCPWKS